MSHQHDASRTLEPEPHHRNVADIEIDRFLADPGDYFGRSHTAMMALPRQHLEALQIAGLKRRYEHVRGKLPMLDKLADAQGIQRIEKLEDVLPLLFDHATYKSYPASLLEKGRFAQLTNWLNKLTTVDLSRVDVSACRSIDDWIATLARETPLAVVHTSGTSGTMSFLPRARRDFLVSVAQYPLLHFQPFGVPGPAPRTPLNIQCIYPFFRSGALQHTTVNDAVVAIIAGSEDRFHAAYPERLSADLMLLAARRRAAAAKGELDKMIVSPELAARRDEFEAQQRDMPRRLDEFFQTLLRRLAGQRIFMMAAISMLFGLADQGLKRGIRNVFAPDSVLVTGGGGKGTALPENWEPIVQEFLGVERLHMVYGMSEMAGTFVRCEHGHYHGSPWIIPFILDPQTSQPLPRKGRVTGRFAFYDLLPDTQWGGFVSGDEVTMEWDAPCACGRTTPYLCGSIGRITARKGEDGEEKLTCAAAPDAYEEALEFLNEDLA